MTDEEPLRVDPPRGAEDPPTEVIPFPGVDDHSNMGDSDPDDLGPVDAS